MSDTPAVDTAKAVFQSIPLDQIQPSRHQARKQFDEESIKALAESMKQEGLLQPITARQIPEGFELIGGERRLRAAKLLGWTAIDAKIIQTVSEGESAAKGLIENLQREDLNPIEEAEGFYELNQLDPIYWTHEEIAEVCGKNRTYVTKLINILKLPQEVQMNVRRRTLTLSIAIELAGLSSPEAQLEAAKAIEGLNREQARKILAALKERPDAKDSSKAAKPPKSDGFDFKMDGQCLVIHGRIALGSGEEPAQKLADLVKEAFLSWATGQAQSAQVKKMPDLPEAVQNAMPSSKEEFKQMEQEQKNIRLPQNDQEMAELEMIAKLSPGPGPIYAKVCGANSLLAQKMAKLTWAEVGISDPVAGCRQLVAGLRQMAGGSDGH
jgi:ParB family chromosome partitioning protein